MIKFIIIEDDTKYFKAFENVVKKVMMKNDDHYEIIHFDSFCSGLQKIIEDSSMKKVYIMDIELKGKVSGLDIAKEIRIIDWDSEILFITSHDKMFEIVYRSIFKIFDFIEKFCNMEKRLEDDLYKIVSMNFDKKKFCYENQRICMQIYLKDILYIYRDTYERNLVIKTINGDFKLNMNINEILSKLDDRFKQVHRACIVNTDQVNLYNWSQGYFILKTNEKVQLCSRNFRGNIK